MTKSSRTFQAKGENHSILVILMALAMLIVLICWGRTVHAEEDGTLRPNEVHRVNIENTEYQLTDINGNQVSTLADGKPKILFFFNTTCPRCKAVEESLITYGVNTDKVDFVMAESSINGITEEQARDFYGSCEVERTSQCYGSVDVCWNYLRACGYTEETTKKPIIIYISADNVIKGFTWNYTNIYKAAEGFGIHLEKDGHHWKTVNTTVEEDGYDSTFERCAACRMEGMHIVKVPEPETIEFVYNGKEQSVLSRTGAYTVVDGCKTDAGEYEATVSLKDTANCVWDNGNFSDYTILWSIKKAPQKIVVTTSSKTMKKSALKKKAQSFSLKVTGAEGQKKYEKLSGSARVKVDSISGKVTVKKGTPKGKYRIKVKVTAAETENYLAGTSAEKTIIIRVK